MEAVHAGCASTLFSATRLAAVTCAIINPDSRRVTGQERRQLLVERGINQTIDAALRDACQCGERDGQKIELQSQRFAVEIAAGENLLAEDQRVIGGGVRSISKTRRASARASRTGPCTCGMQRKRVGILHALAADVDSGGSRCLRAACAAARPKRVGRGADAPDESAGRKLAACHAERRA